LLQQIISVIIILQMMADRNFERISSIMWSDIRYLINPRCKWMGLLD
jgi:hypothetical protein